MTNSPISFRTLTNKVGNPVSMIFVNGKWVGSETWQPLFNGHIEALEHWLDQENDP